MSRIAGLLLAAGPSSRMEGASKLLLPWEGSTVVAAAAAAALAGGLSPLWVVVGHDGETVRRALRDLAATAPLHIVQAPDAGEGLPVGTSSAQGSSLAAGLRALEESPEPPDAAGLVLGDEPGLQPRAVAAVRKAFLAAAAPAARAVYADRPGHPVLVAARLFPRLRELGGRDRGAGELLESLGDDLLRVALPYPAPVDVDSRAAYRRAVQEGDG